MQEEVEQKTVNLAVTTTKLTGRVAVKEYSAKQLDKAKKPRVLRI